jgi:hypothetical protein
MQFSFDHLVGTAKVAEANGKAEHFCGLEIDDQLHLRGLLDRQIGGSVDPDNPAGIDASEPVSARLAP